ncbi:UNVERIFIED_CONTAM: Cellulose synthase-like protein E6 [Sesamum radiatum]|uniref:Cellulose synthase-like protein E6 n=1 Tax=Sesamum radiatum TaxID=300843 RepID=A0AAW2K3B7_SESRA
MIGTLALLNLFSFGYEIKNAVFFGAEALAEFASQIIVPGLTVMVNYPVYEAFFMRRDKGSIPSSVMFKSVAIASVACLIPIY